MALGFDWIVAVTEQVTVLAFRCSTVRRWRSAMDRHLGAPRLSVALSERGMQSMGSYVLGPLSRHDDIASCGFPESLQFVREK